MPWSTASCSETGRALPAWRLLQGSVSERQQVVPPWWRKHRTVLPSSVQGRKLPLPLDCQGAQGLQPHSPPRPEAFELCTSCTTVHDIPGGLSTHHLRFKFTWSHEVKRLLSALFYSSTLKLREAESLARGYTADRARVSTQSSVKCPLP